MIASILFLVSLVAFALSDPLARRAMVVHETQVLPQGFSSRGAASPETMLNLRIALAQTDPDGLIASLMDVSTPGNALYGQHLTKEEVEAFVAPKPDTVEAVQGWLKENDITAQTNSPAGDWLSFSVPVSKANELLDTEFTVVTHDATNTQSVRTLSYSIPADLQEHVLLVHPTITFTGPLSGKPLMVAPKPQMKANVSPSNLSSDAVPASCGSTITPACLLSLYSIPMTRFTQHTNQLGVSGFIDQFANDDDLQTFLGSLRRDLVGRTFDLQTLDGGSNPQDQADAGIEADLDVQYTIGLNNGVPTVFISVGLDGSDGLSGFLDIINDLLGQSAPPQVLSTSYGFDDEHAIARSLANSLCNAYAQLGARGVSILFSSGDSGVGSPNSCAAFQPAFPSGCPFVTSVGATAGVPESSASFSSGGFSVLFPRPSYQATAVAAYLAKLGNTNAGKFNSSGRGFPDVAALGNNVEIIFQQEAMLVGGTSCSCPIFASIISLINDRLVAAGKPVLGFLNPFLYGVAASTFTDITKGSNPGCGTNGFPASAGWDPVTGLGTPSFTALLTAAGL